MACDLYLAASFPELQEQLLGRLCTADGGSPLAPRWVVVPTSTLAGHLRREAASTGDDGAVAGVRIVPLEVLVDRLRSRMAPSATRWEPLLDLLLQEAAGRIPASSALGGLRNDPAAFDLLRPTLQDLADAGFGADQIELLHELAADGGLRPLEADVLRLFAGWVELLTEAGIAWQPLADQQLAGWIEALDPAELHTFLGAEAGQEAEVLFHGFYELTDVNTGLLCALARQLTVSLYFPDCGDEKRSHPAFQFARSYLDELRLRLGPALGTERRAPPSTLTAHFFTATFPDGPSGEQPGWLTLQSACGRRAEVVAAAARVRAWLDAQPARIGADEIVVAMPEPQSYIDVIRDVFAQFAIPVRALDVAETQPAAGRPLRLLIRLWQEGAAAEQLLAYMREAPHVTARRGVDLDHFEVEFRRSRCWGGSSCRTLIEMARQGQAALTPAEVDFLERVAATWAAPPPPARTVAEWVGWIEELEREWLADSVLLQPLIAGLQRAAQLRPALELQTETVQRLLAAAAAAGPVSDPAERGGVVVVPLMRARGLTCRAMVLLGLAAGTFPVQLEEDPLLSDDSRRRLRTASGQAGHRLALTAALSDEMALLFLLLNTSAEVLHWVVPETDELGKAVSPTPWVQRYQQHWAAKALPRIPRGPRQQAATLAQMSPSGDLLPPGLGFLLDNRLAELVGDAAHYAHVGRTRRVQAIQPDWQGFIRAPGWKPALPDPQDPPRVSVTRLESLARCPYRFYAEQVAGWTPLELLRFSPGLRPIDWGSLVHRFLETVLNPAVGKPTRLAERAAELLRDDGAALKRLARRLPPKLSPAFRFLPAVLGDATRWRLFRLTAAYLGSVGDRCADGRLEIQELKLRRPFPGLDPVLISGVVDRVDIETDGTRTVVDYKSGRPPWAGNRRRRDREVGLGFFMQPWLYPWLLPSDDSRPRPGFRYLYLGGDEPTEVPIQPPAAPEELLAPLARILREGFFFPTSNETLSRVLGESVEPCLYCSLPSLCRRFESRRTRQAMRWLLTWVPERFGAAPEDGT